MSEYSFTDWAIAYDALAYDVMMGSSILDLPDDEIELLRELYRDGVSVFELFDLVTEYTDAE